MKITLLIYLGQHFSFDEKEESGPLPLCLRATQTRGFSFPEQI